MKNYWLKQNNEETIMAKKKSDDIINFLAKATKAEVLGNTTPVRYFIDTGNLAFNWSCSGRFMGGGIPGGRISEFYGPEGSGKTYWGCNVVRGCQAIGGIPVYLDCENSLNNDWIVKTSHIDLDRTLVFDPSSGVDSLEGCFDKIYSTIRNLREKDPDTPLVFVYDSLSASPSNDELQETTRDWNPDKKDQPGTRARICSKEFRKLNTLMEKTNCTLLVLNQTRMKIGVLYGSPIISGGGGESLKFYASLRVCTAVQKKIENKKLGTAMGINLKVRNVKNRCTAPFLEAEGVQLYWKDGVNPLSGLLTALIQSARIDKAGNGTYVIKEPWAAGQEIKFRASKARNDIDADTLYKCPALVDAKDEQELRDYIAIFGSAISQSQNEENEETDAGGPDAGDYE